MEQQSVLVLGLGLGLGFSLWVTRPKQETLGEVGSRVSKLVVPFLGLLLRASEGIMEVERGLEELGLRD